MYLGRTTLQSLIAPLVADRWSRDSLRRPRPSETDRIRCVPGAASSSTSHYASLSCCPWLHETPRRVMRIAVAPRVDQPTAIHSACEDRRTNRRRPRSSRLLPGTWPGHVRTGGPQSHAGHRVGPESAVRMFSSIEVRTDPRSSVKPCVPRVASHQ